MNRLFATSQKPVGRATSVNEALRLKNEIAGTLNGVQGLTRYGGLI